VVGKGGGLTLLCGSKTTSTKRIYRNAFWWIDLIDQICCNHVSYKAPCKCVLDIIIIVYTQTYVCTCTCIHMDTCGTSRWAWYYIVHFAPIIFCMHMHCLPSWALNKHLWKLNSCTHQEQWKLNIYMFRSWHSVHTLRTQMPHYICQLLVVFLTAIG